MLRLLLVGLCYLTGTVLASGSATFGACLFLWNDIFRPLSFAHANGRYPVAWYVLFVLVGSYAVNLARGRFRPQFGAFFVWFLVLMAWVAVTWAASPFKIPATAEFVRMQKYLLPLILIYTCMRNQRDIEMVAGTLSASVMVWAAQAGVICLLTGPRIDLGIEGGQMSDRNDFTAGVVGTLPWIIFFLWSYEWKFKRAVRAGLLLILALSLVAIVMSLSRGASVGLGATILCYIAFISRKKARDLAIVAVLLGVVLAALPQAWWDRMSTIEVGKEQKEGSARNRMALMLGAWQATLDRPLTGWGPDGWLQVVHIYGDGGHSPHNIYLKVSSEFGLPGLALYLAVLVGTVWRLKRLQIRAARAGNVRAARLAIAFAVGIIGLMTTMTFLNMPFNEYLWAWVVLGNAFCERFRPAVQRRAPRAVGAPRKALLPGMRTKAPSREPAAGGTPGPAAAPPPGA